MTIEQVKKLDIVDYLSSQKQEPQKISGNHYWYLSPFRDERTPSFKVNRKLNRWFDFAEGKGGNLVDLGTLLHRCSVSAFLQRLDNGSLSIQKQAPTSLARDDDNQIKILSTFSVNSYPLMKYLRERKIPAEIANKYLSEVRYQIGDKTYYALGFKNDAGGYELRNQNFKGSSSPKDTTFIDNGAKEVAVFEGFFNFLSYCTINPHQQLQEPNYLILNSASFFEKSLPKMQEHQGVRLFLDNDKTGNKFTELAQSIDKEKFGDERKLYQKYND
ncbi:MAG TPA: toprim domain-containing protein, partial [Flavisolibacter sp.]|nr:toprim domain-containing protein [Flavisolibacter sp.]